MQDNGHVVKGKIHSECTDDNGCGEKYTIEGTGQVVELERDEAVIIPDAFDDKCFGDSFCTRPSKYKMTGTISQIASGINTLGGGADFDSGAKIWKNGRKMNKPRMTARNSRRNPPKLQAGSVVINRTNMLNPAIMTFEGTTYEIASKINSFEGNGVSLMKQGGMAGIEKIKTGESNPKSLNNSYEQPFASRFNRKLFKAGGEIKYSEKQLNNILEKATKRQVEFATLIAKENKKDKDKEALDIATMIVNPLKEKSLLPKQRERLIDWSLNPENKVIYIIAFSGGKDSVAMVLHLLFVKQIPREQIELWHHEVDGMSENLWDWECTPSYCRAFAKELGLKILFSYREGGISKEILKGKDKPERSADIYFQVEENGEFIKSKSVGELKERLMFPAVVSDLQTRWCSGLVKIDVMSRAINNSPRLKDANLIICTGERRLESPNRAGYMEIEPYNFGYGKNMITWRPVIDMTEEDVWKLYEEFSIQPHPSYELGWGRCSCEICIFNGKNQWATTNEINPKKVQKIAEIEKEIGNTLYNEDIKVEKFVPAHQKIGKNGKTRNFKGALKMVSTGEKKDIYQAKVNDGKSFLTPKAKARWVIEAINEFTSPIIVPYGEWKLPDGAYKGETCGAS